MAQARLAPWGRLPLPATACHSPGARHQGPSIRASAVRCPWPGPGPGPGGLPACPVEKGPSPPRPPLVGIRRETGDRPRPDPTGQRSGSMGRLNTIPAAVAAFFSVAPKVKLLDCFANKGRAGAVVRPLGGRWAQCAASRLPLESALSVSGPPPESGGGLGWPRSRTRLAAHCPRHSNRPISVRKSKSL